MQDTSPPPVTASPPRRRSALPTLFVALIAFLLGGALVAGAAMRGYVPASLVRADAPVVAPTPSAPVSNTAQMNQIGSVEGRLAMIEDRLSRVDFQSSAAAGNAGRAEGMLIAFAARRLVERGEPLGTVADQLRLRFTNAQPLAVQTVVEFAANPVTIDGLSARLEALSPELTITGTDQSLWDRVHREVTSLFTVRRDSGALGTPSARIERARLMLTARRIDAAIGEVERLPGADAAETWVTDARRFEAAQRALDLLETTAMLEPNRLQDSQGQSIDQPSPLAPTAPQGDPTEAAAAE